MDLLNLEKSHSKEICIFINMIVLADLGVSIYSGSAWPEKNLHNLYYGVLLGKVLRFILFILYINVLWILNALLSVPINNTTILNHDFNLI